jgi:hypothetical protein
MVIEWDGGEDSGNKGWHEDGECDEDGDGGGSDKCDGNVDGGDGGEDSGNKGWHDVIECDEDRDGGGSDKCDGNVDGD